jgi:hypothetical protein
VVIEPGDVVTATPPTCAVPAASVISVHVIARATMLPTSVIVMVSVVAIWVVSTQYQTDTTDPSAATPSVSVFSVALTQTLLDPEALSAMDEWSVDVPSAVPMLSVWHVTTTSRPTTKLAEGNIAIVPRLVWAVTLPRDVTAEKAITSSSPGCRESRHPPRASPASPV